MAGVLDRVILDEGPGANLLLRQIEKDRMELARKYRELLSGIDVSERSRWPGLIAGALQAGIREDDLLRELGASTSTLSRWLNDKVAPREGTRKLMKDAILRLLDETFASAPVDNQATERRTAEC